MAKKDVSVKKEKREMQPFGRGRMLSPFDEMEREMERWFDHFGRNWIHPFRSRRPFWADFEEAFEGKIPSVDVIDRDNEVLIRAELPGVDKKDLEVTLTDDALTIKGTSKSETEEEKGDYYRREVSSGSFSRTVLLPTKVDGDKASSSFKDGLLELTLPKVKSTERKTIKVE